MKTKAILFDLDGTVLDTLNDLCTSVNFALNALDLPTRPAPEIRTILGNGARNLIARAVPEGTSEEVYEKCFSVFTEHYEVNKTNTTAPYSGIPELMKKLRGKGYKLAIVSNKPNDAVQGLYERFFADSVDFALGTIDSLARKPEPDMVYYTLEKLGVERDSAIYIGDSEVDIETARNSKLPCISVSWGFRNEEELVNAGATTIISSTGDLFDAIEKIANA